MKQASVTFNDPGTVMDFVRYSQGDMVQVHFFLAGRGSFSDMEYLIRMKSGTDPTGDFIHIDGASREYYIDNERERLLNVIIYVLLADQGARDMALLDICDQYDSLEVE